MSNTFDEAWRNGLTETTKTPVIFLPPRDLPGRPGQHLKRVSELHNPAAYHRVIGTLCLNANVATVHHRVGDSGGRLAAGDNRTFSLEARFMGSFPENRSGPAVPRGADLTP